MSSIESLKQSLQFNEKAKYKNLDTLTQKIENIKANKLSNLFIISDFDATISRHHHDNDPEKKRLPGTMSVLEHNENLCQQTKDFCRANFEKFYPIEMDSNLSYEEKLPKMVEWWSSSLIKIVEEKVITKTGLVKSVRNSKLVLRKNADKFLSKLGTAEVPVLIFSAGCGNVIEIALTYGVGLDDGDIQRTGLMGLMAVEGPKDQNSESPQNSLWHDKTMVICSNNLIFDEKSDLLCGFDQPLIHSLNKSDALARLGSSLDHKVAYEKLLAMTENKTSLIVLGDHINDVNMKMGMEQRLGLEKGSFKTTPINPNNSTTKNNPPLDPSNEDSLNNNINTTQSSILNIGFLNYKKELNLGNFLNRYDLVLDDDQSFDAVLEILEYIGV